MSAPAWPVLPKKPTHNSLRIYNLPATNLFSIFCTGSVLQLIENKDCRGRGEGVPSSSKIPISEHRS